MYGEIIILNPRTNEERVARGVFTRNFAKLLKLVLNEYSLSTDYVLLRDVNNLEFDILTRGILREANAKYYNNVYVHASSDPIYYCYHHTGLTAKVSDTEHTPSPNDYNIPDIRDTVLLTSVNIIENPNNTILAISGSKPTSEYLVVRTVGIFARVFKFLFSANFSCGTREILIDSFSITPIEFSAGDTISITYKITLA